MFHGSPEKISEIKPYGHSAFDRFGGIFASDDEDAAKCHGDFLYRVVSFAHLDDFTLNYELGEAWDAAVALCGGDESLAEAIMDAECPGEDQWEIQRLRGELAKSLGYTSVEMRDEHGTTYLCLPGCEIELIKRGQNDG